MTNSRIEICRVKSPNRFIKKVVDKQESPACPQQKKLSSYHPNVIKGSFKIVCS